MRQILQEHEFEAISEFQIIQDNTVRLCLKKGRGFRMGYHFISSVIVLIRKQKIARVVKMWKMENFKHCW
jgi:hypothetical protein